MENIMQEEAVEDFLTNNSIKGEMSLVSCVLSRGICEYFKGKTKSDDEYWLFYDDSVTPFSFKWCCGILGLNARNLRKHLRIIEKDPEFVKIALETYSFL